MTVSQSAQAILLLLSNKKEDEMELLPGKEQHVWLVMAVKRMQPVNLIKCIQ